MVGHTSQGLTRRDLLILTLTGLGTVMLGGTACARNVAGPCRRTPAQTEGPFYPIEDQLDEDNDLTVVTGGEGRAEGQVVYVLGQVQDARCRPVTDARVEIWQASARGRYRHPYDRDNPVPLDPNFQGWGEAVTREEGRYLFKTVHPGQYPAGPGWTRPSHIHFKVRHAEFAEMTTQMYFTGDAYLERDRIFLGVPPAERSRVVVSPEHPGPDFPPDAVVYRFDLTLG